MKRRPALRLTAPGIMAGVAALALQKPNPDKLLVLEWALKAAPETPATAILVEMGFKDAQEKNWNGSATITELVFSSAFQSSGTVIDWCSTDILAGGSLFFFGSGSLATTISSYD